MRSGSAPVTGTVGSVISGAMVVPGSVMRTAGPVGATVVTGGTAPGTVKALQLAAVQNDIICVIGDNNVVVNDPNNCIIVVNPPPPPPPNNCPVVCATACAQADAKAFAQAWAHASATACAWAQAWACVYNGVFPFNRVCAWAQSQACFTAFASAFGVGWAWESERRCRKECSDGRVWEWFERPKLGGN